MTTATKIAAAAPVTPLGDWDDEPCAITEFTTPAGMAGCVAWDVLTHLQGYGADMARAVKLPLPEGAESEDMHDFLWNLVTAAGEIGYRVANVNIAGFDLPSEKAKITEEDMARAVIALMRRKPVETEEAFDPDWIAKRDAKATAARMRRHERAFGAEHPDAPRAPREATATA